MATKSIIQAGGGDYTTIQAWENALPATLSEAEIGEIQDTATYAENVVIDGHTTTATNTITLTVGDAYWHKGQEGVGAHIEPSGSGHAVSISTDYTTIERLELSCGPGSSDEGVRVDANYVNVRRNIIHEKTSTSQNDCVYVIAGVKDATVENCVLADVQRAGINFQWWSGTLTETAYIRNNLFYNCGTGGSIYDGGIISDVRNASINLTIEGSNNIAHAAGSRPAFGDIGSTAATWIGDGNISHDTTATARFGAGSPANLNSRTITDHAGVGTGDWVVVMDLRAAHRDYTLQDVAENDAVGAGKDLSPDATVDILGNTRGATWDSGPHQNTGFERTKLAWRVVADAGNAEQMADGGGYSRTGILTVEQSSNAGARSNAGIWFDNVYVPQGATIDAAVANLYCQTNIDVYCDVYAHDVDDAPSFPASAGANDLDDRLETTPVVTTAKMTIALEDDATAGQWYDFDSQGTGSALKAVVEEVIGRGSWASGNALAILFDGTDAADIKVFDFPSYAQDNDLAARIEIAWTSGGGGQTIGMQAIASGESVFNPAALPGAVSFVSQLIASGETFFQPAVLQRIALQAIASGESVPNPTVSPGAVALTAQLIASGETLFSPAVVQRLAAQLIASSESVPNPTTTVGGVSIAAQVISSAEAFFNPTVTQPAAGSPVFNAVTSGAFNDSSGTVNHTAAGTDRGAYIQVAIDVPGSEEVSTVTYDGQSCTRVDFALNGTASRAELWHIVNPPTTTNAAVIVTLTATKDFGVGVTSYTNLNQSTPHGTAVTNTGNDDAPSTDISSATNELVIDALAVDLSRDITTDASQTARVDDLAISNVHSLSSSEEAGAATVTMSYSLNLSANWAHVVVGLKPAAGGATIGAQAIATAEVVPNPTIAPGGVSLTAQLISSAEVVPNPSIVPGAVTIGAQIIGSAESVPNPALRQQIAMQAISSAESVPNPTVSTGPVTITAQIIGSAESVLNPSLLQRIAMQTIGSAEAVPNPTVTPGPVTIVAQAIPTAENVLNPAVSLGGSFIAAQAIASGEAVNNPTVAPGGVTIVVQAIASGEAVLNPTVQPGGVTVAAQAIPTSEVVFNPTVAVGTLFLGAQLIGSAENVPNPTIAPGGVTISLQAIPTAEAVFNPAVSVGVQLVGAQAIASGEVVLNPTITVGGVSIAVQAVGSAESVPNPTVQPGGVTVAAQAIPTSEVVFNPALRLLIKALQIASAEIVQNPSVAVGAVTLQLQKIASAEALYAVTIVGGSQVLGPYFFDAGEIFAPGQASGEIFTPGMNKGEVK